MNDQNIDLTFFSPNESFTFTVVSVPESLTSFSQLNSLNFFLYLFLIFLLFTAYVITKNFP